MPAFMLSCAGVAPGRCQLQGPHQQCQVTSLALPLAGRGRLKFLSPADQVPVKRGLRFSMKAAWPSL